MEEAIFEQSHREEVALAEKSPKHIEVMSNKIVLIKIIDQNFYEGRIVLNNVTEKFIVYKFIIDQNLTYSITPSVYFIQPYGSVTVNVKRFEKLSVTQIKSNEYLSLISIMVPIEIKDINDAKTFLKHDDIYSSVYQQLKIQIEYDNGSNPVNYSNLVNERMTIAKEYNEQLNMNNVSSIEEVQKYIEEVKNEICEYEDKISRLSSKLGDINRNNIIKQPKIIFDKNEFEKSFEHGKNINDNSFNSYPLFLVILCCCISLYIGKFLHWLI